MQDTLCAAFFLDHELRRPMVDGRGPWLVATMFEDLKHSETAQPESHCHHVFCSADWRIDGHLDKRAFADHRYNLVVLHQSRDGLRGGFRVPLAIFG